MPVRRIFHPVWFLWFAPVFCGLLANPSAARAGCGDHAHATTSELVLSLASLVPFDGILLEPRALPSPTTPPRPCDGPSCSQQRHAAPTATPVVHRVSPERGLVTFRVDPPPVPGVRWTLARRQAAYESPALDRPDRPPQP